MERMELVKYLEKKEKYRTLRSKRNRHVNQLWRQVGWWLLHPIRLARYNKLHEMMAFHDIRWQFIYYRNLQPEFRFSKFLRKIKMATFIDLVQIHPLNWILLLILVIGDIVRGRIYRSATNNVAQRNFEPIFFIAHSAINIIFVTVLAIKIRKVYWKLTKNPATYYDTVDPHAFRQELAIAEEEARIRHESNIELDDEDDDDNPMVKSTSRRSLQLMSRKADKRPNDKPPQEPIYSTMGHKRETPPSPTTRERHSLDMSKARADRERPLPAREENKPPHYRPGMAAQEVQPEVPHNNRVGGAVANELLQTAVQQQETNGTRMSLEMATVMPTQELDLRADPTSMRNAEFWARDPEKLKHLSDERRKLRMEALRRLRERQQHNVGLVETAQDLQAAQNASPPKNYPEWLVRFFPRIGRVPSAAERLFWFGSHRFYLFSVENVLFFTNINLSASVAKLIFYYKEVHENQKDIKAGRQPESEPLDDIGLLIAALCVSFVALFYVLLRIAGIMRKYIFVLNNANLLPEDMTITTIQTMNLKDMMNAETMHDGSGQRLVRIDSESETDNDDDTTSYSLMRRNISRQIESEHSHLPTTLSVEDQEVVPEGVTGSG